MPPMKKRTFAEILKQARLAADISQQELANRTGLARVYIAQLEIGTKSKPSLDVVEAIGKALGDVFKEPVRKRYLPRDKKKRR